MTETAPVQTTQGPSEDARAAISAIFNERPITRNMDPVPAGVPSTAQPQQAAPSAAEPNGSTNPEAANGQPPGLDPQGQPAPSADGAHQSQNMVPGSRLKEEADRRRAAEQRAYDLEMRLAQTEGFVQAIQQQPVQQAPQPQAPQDPYPLPPQFKSAADFMIIDPDGHAAWVENRAAWRAEQKASQELSSIRDQMQKSAWRSDEAIVTQKFGAQFVAEVKEFVRQNRQLAAEFSKHPDPYSRAINYVRQETINRAIPNGDLRAYEMSVAEKLLNNPEFIREVQTRFSKQQGQAAPASVPPSLSAMPRSGASGPVLDTKDDIHQLFASRRGQPS